MDERHISVIHKPSEEHSETRAAVRLYMGKCCLEFSLLEQQVCIHRP